MRTPLALAAALAAAPAFAAPITYDESIDGDLSDDRLAPTVLALGLGINSFTVDVVDSNSPTGDRDYFTFNVGAGEQISSVVLRDASNPQGGFDAVAFLGFDSGDTFGFDPDTFMGSLNGFVLTTPDLFGTDILPALNSEAGAPSVPVGPGDYTFWIQQTGADLTRVSFDVVLTPTPTTLAPLALAGLAGARRRRA